MGLSAFLELGHFCDTRAVQMVKWLLSVDVDDGTCKSRFEISK